MAKEVQFSPAALEDIDDILSNVSEYTGSVASGIKLFSEFSEKFEHVGFLPKSGKNRGDGTRETFCRGYRIVYEEFDAHILILTIIHSRRKYPRDSN